MGKSKLDLFTVKQNEMAIIAKCLGHPARIAIIEHLLKSDTCINSDLVKEIGLAQATVSQHLKELKQVGLIQGTIEGTSMCYCIDPKVWKSFKDSFNALFDQHVVCNPNCC